MYIYFLKIYLIIEKSIKLKFLLNKLNIIFIYQFFLFYFIFFFFFFFYLKCFNNTSKIYPFFESH